MQGTGHLGARGARGSLINVESGGAGDLQRGGAWKLKRVRFPYAPASLLTYTPPTMGAGRRDQDDTPSASPSAPCRHLSKSRPSHPCQSPRATPRDRRQEPRAGGVPNCNNDANSRGTHHRWHAERKRDKLGAEGSTTWETAVPSATYRVRRIHVSSTLLREPPPPKTGRPEGLNATVSSHSTVSNSPS